MRNASTFLERNDLRIEDGISSTLPSKESRRKGSLDYLKQVENETRDKSENEKNRNQEDNKVKDLNQEIEKLKTQIKHFESLEEELKKMRAKNNDLQDNYLTELNKNRSLASQLEEVKLQVRKQKELGNGDIEGEDAFLLGRGRHERTKLKGHGGEVSVSKHTSREQSPQHKRERPRNRGFALNDEHCSLSNKQVSSPAFTNKRAAKASNMGVGPDSGTQETKRTEDRCAPGSSQSEGKKGREQPSVLSRYPPAAQEHTKVWRGTPKPGTESGLKGKVEKTTRTFSDSAHGSVPNDVVGKGDKTSDFSSEAHCGKRGQVPGHASQVTQVAESGCSKAIGALSSSQRASSEGLCKGKKAANGLETDANFPHSKAPILSKYPYSSRSQENILQGFSVPNKEGVDHSVAVVMEDSSQHEALRCRVIKSSGREKPDSDDDLDIESLVTAKLVNTTITPEPEPKLQPNSREKVKSRGGTRTTLFENDKNAAVENDSAKSMRSSSNAVEFPDANCAGVKNQRPFSPREALRSRAIIKPVIIDKDVKKIMGGSGTEVVLEKQKSTPKSVTSKVTSSITIYPSDSSGPRAVPAEAPRERHTSTSNIQVGPPELTSVSNHISSPLELSIHKHDITLQLTEAERVGDGSPKNRAETVVSRSSILIKPSDSVERNSYALPAETIRWKSHSTSSEVASSDTRHITVRNAWKSKRDLKCSEDPPTRIGRNVEATNAYTQRSSTDFLELEQPRSHPPEQGTRKVGNSGDAPELSSRRTQSSLTASEVLTRRNRIGDAVTTASWNHSSNVEEGEDSTFVSSRRVHNPLEHSEPPGKQGLPESERVWTEERLHPARPYAEED